MSSNSIVPYRDQRDIWDWDPFQSFPLPSMLFPYFPSSIFPSSHETLLNWRETPTAHVLRAVFPAFSEEDNEVLVYIDDDNMLQISTGNGNFMTKFKVPDNARRDQVQAFMSHGVLTVTIPKANVHRPDVRVVEISGSD